jgi:ketopantoate reductase
MKRPVIIVGMGEMGGVFARGFLKAGYPVYPALRNDDLWQLSDQVEAPELVLLAVAEKDFDSAAKRIPDPWRDKLVLLQNELLPGDWQRHNLDAPTVISVWFEKKPGMDFKVLVPSPVRGPRANSVAEALGSLGIPATIIDNEADMLFELVRKNMYIVTTNVCGLETGGTVSELWRDNAEIMNRVFDDVLAVQQALTHKDFNRNDLLSAVLTAFDGDPDHKCMGRSAPQRLQRALEQAAAAELEVPALQEISEKTQK